MYSISDVHGEDTIVLLMFMMTVELLLLRLYGEEYERIY